MVDFTVKPCYTICMMKTITYTIYTVTLLQLTACSNMIEYASVRDPRCQPGQYCIYTDSPPAIRTSVLRPQDPAVR